MSLVLTHAKYHFLETVRIPMALIGTAVIPTATMLAFVVPFAWSDPAAATYATASMVVFATLAACVFQYGIGVAEDRAQPWEPYTRTLPAGPLPRFIGRVLNVMLLTVVSLVPVLLIAALFTEATLTPAGLALGIGALLLASLPFTLLGLAVGYSMPQKAAIAVAQLLFFPLAFGGGLLFGVPSRLPGFLDVVAPFLPTRGAVELVWAATNDFTPKATSMVMFAVWTVVAAGVAVWAYRRDEGRRYA